MRHVYRGPFSVADVVWNTAIGCRSDAAPYALGMSQNQHQDFMDWNEAVKYYERAYMDGATRTVSRPPPPSGEGQPRGTDGKKQPEGRSNGGRWSQQRKKREDSPAGSIQATTSKGSSAGRTARDAQIGAALTEARENSVGPSASSPSVISSERTRTDKAPRHTALAPSATEPVYHPQSQVQSSPTVSPRTPSRPVLRTVELPPFELEPEFESQPRTPETKTTSSRPASDIPTNETQTRIQFESSPGPPIPWYAQSLSYASSPSSSLASSDVRTHLSSPSSFGTRYFPEDWLARQEHDDHEVRSELQSPVSTLSEYATAPNTPEMGSNEVGDDMEDVRDMASPSPSMRDRVGLSEPSSPNSRSLVERSKTWPSAMPLPESATEVISSSNATSTPQHTSSTPNSVNDNFFPSVARVLASCPSPEPEKKTTTHVTRSPNKAEARIDSLPPRVCYYKNLAPAPARQNLDDQVETSPVASPLHASTGVGDIPVRPPLGGSPCRCEHPEYACIHCGRRPRTGRRSAWSCTRHSRSPRAPSVSTATTTASPPPPEVWSVFSSPVPAGTPASAVRSSVSVRSSSSRSHIGGHTPIMGPSATRAHAHARTQASLGLMSFSEAAQGVTAAEAVVLDVSFDPRSSPIQRGTRVPAGYVRSLLRTYRMLGAHAHIGLVGLPGLLCGFRLRRCRSR